MSNRNSPFADALDEVIGKPKRELVDQPRDEALKIAQAPAAVKFPWSKYVPFSAGTELAVEGHAVLTFDGNGKVEELTDNQLAISFKVQPHVPLVKDSDLAKVSARIAVTYKEDGGSNLAVFSINGGDEKKKAVSIQSTADERILTAPGGLEIQTLLDPPLPETVTLKALRIKPGQGAVDLQAEFEDFLIPTAAIHAVKKPPEAKK
jgi:hypothetical protein